MSIYYYNKINKEGFVLIYIVEPDNYALYPINSILGIFNKLMVCKFRRLGTKTIPYSMWDEIRVFQC
jgi:hypothetical protein